MFGILSLCLRQYSLSSCLYHHESCVIKSATQQVNSVSCSLYSAVRPLLAYTPTLQGDPKHKLRMKIAELMLQMPEGETLEKSLAAVMKDRMGSRKLIIFDRVLLYTVWRAP